MKPMNAGVLLVSLLLGGCASPETFRVERPLLTEDLAIAKARETLTREGYNINQWRLSERNSLQRFYPDWVRVSFTDGSRWRKYDVKLESRVICRAFHGI